MKVVSAYGYRLGFDWDFSAGEAAVEEVCLPNWPVVEGPADARLSLRQAAAGFQIIDDGQLWTTAPDPESMRHRLQQLTQIRLTTGATAVDFVHAGVVLMPAGLVVLPGPSKAGKSTLVRALVEAGGRFFSDEYAVIDRLDGRVHPYPRALWTRLSRTRRTATPAADLGWGPDLQPAPIGLLLFTNYRAGAVWNPLALDRERALAELLPHCPARRPPRLQATALFKTPRGQVDPKLVLELLPNCDLSKPFL